MKYKTFRKTMRRKYLYCMFVAMLLTIDVCYRAYSGPPTPLLIFFYPVSPANQYNTFANSVYSDETDYNELSHQDLYYLQLSLDI